MQRRVAKRNCAKAVLMVLSAFVMSACAVMTEKECQNADWNTYGFLDGSQGYAKTFLNSRTKACQEHGIGVGVDAYLQGWQRGVRQYCLPDNAFAEGKRGAEYEGICPLDMEKPFVHYYQEGRIVYAAQKRVNDIVYEREALQEAIKTTELDLDKVRVQLDDAQLKQAEKQALLAKLEALYQLKAKQSLDIDELYQLQEHAEAHLRFLQRQHPRPYFPTFP